MGMSMTEEQLVELLSNISATGFTNLQAKAYISLLKIGESTGSAIAEQSGINRSKIYDVLGDLEAMGAVARISREGKAKYVAIDPEIVFKGISSSFLQILENGKDALLKLKDTFEFLSETGVTFTKLNLQNLNVNDFHTLVATTEKARLRFLEVLPPHHRPNQDVLLVTLNVDLGKGGLIMLINAFEVIVLNVPTSYQVNNALRFLGSEYGKFFGGLIRTTMEKSIPDAIKLEFEKGKRKVLAVELVQFMRYTLANGSVRHEHARPVLMVVTDTHISFIFEEEEDPKIPIGNIGEVVLDGETLVCSIFGSKQQLVGTLMTKPVRNAVLLKNIIEFASPLIR